MKWNVDDYNKNASYVSQYGRDVLLLLAPEPNEYILDLGCGDGELAEKISISGCAVTAIDASEEMIVAARRRGIDAYVVCAEEMVYQNKFNAVFSNAALHWMKDADRVVDNVYRSLKIGGRFCAEMGGVGNVHRIIQQIYTQLEKRGLRGELYNPWFFPSEEEYASKLERAGFHIERIEKFERLTPLATDVAGWLRTFAKPFLQDIPQSEHKNFIDAIKDGVSNELQNERGEWFADYVRLRFLAKK